MGERDISGAAFCAALPAVLLTVALSPTIRAADLPAAPLLPARISLAEAVRVTLAQDPNIAVQRAAVAYYQGQAESASGAFDLTAAAKVQASRTRTPAVYQDPSTQEEMLQVSLQDNAQYQVSLSQKTRWGLTLQPQANVTRTVNHTPGEIENTASQVGFTLLVPLARGLGYRPTTAAERAARTQVEAAEASLRDRVAAEALATVNAYWNCRAAELSLAIYREAESNALRTVNITRAMISGSLQTEANLEQANANYDGAMASRLVAEKSFAQAALALATAMGLTPDQLPATPLAADDFPEMPPDFDDSSAMIEALVRDALRDRPDLRSASLNEEAAAVLLEGARDNLLPQLDASLFGGYAGVDSGGEFSRYATALTRNAQGLNVQGSLAFTWPVQNRAALGQYASQIASRDQYRSQHAQKAAQVVSDVMLDVRSVALGLAALRKSEASTQAYRHAVRNQETLFELGSGSLLDVINTQTSLANAQIQELNARVSCLKALAQLRCDLGRLVEEDGRGAFRVDTAALCRPPAPRPGPLAAGPGPVPNREEAPP
jgi:outer membrane protein TolC